LKTLAERIDLIFKIQRFSAISKFVVRSGFSFAAQLHPFRIPGYVGVTEMFEDF
jgi:hypothetical protein